MSVAMRPVFPERALMGKMWALCAEAIMARSSSDTTRARTMPWFFGAVFLFGIGALFLSVLNFFSGPSIGSIRAKDEALFSEVAPAESRVKEFRGTHFSAFLPESCEEKRHETERLPGNMLERVFCAEADANGRTIAISIETLPSGGVRELSAVAFRMLHPERYRREELPADDRSLVVFTKDEAPSEVTGFFEKGRRAASVSVSSPNLGPEKIRELFLETVRSFMFLESAMSSG